MSAPLKYCKECETHLLPSSFSKGQTQCKACRSAKARARYRENPSRSREATLRWELRNPEKVQVAKRDRRARYKAQKKHAFVAKVYTQRIYARDEGTCYLCDREVPYTTTQFDHLIPISRGGCHAPENVAVSCQGCNTAKSNKLPQELPIEKGLRVLRKLRAIPSVH